MGFKKVYKVLLEIFPEVDSRALKAVAIEHHKDADAAVEAVLTEVIPFLTERSTISSSSSKNRIIAQPPQATVGFANGPPSSSNDVLVENVKCQEEEQHVPFYDAKAELQTFHDANYGLHEMYLDSRPETSVNGCDEGSGKVSSGSLVHENGANAGTGSVSGDCACEETLYGVPQESSTLYRGDQYSQLHLMPLEHSQLHLKPLGHGHVYASQGLDYCQDSKSVHTENLEKENVLLNAVDHLSPLVSEPSDIQISDLEKELDGLDTALNTEAYMELVDLKDDSVSNTVVTRSSQVCSTDLLEDMISGVRNNKKILLSAVEIILGLMKEVEAQENTAKQAKEDAANGGIDILKRVEDLKQALAHANEANDMHSGEVYGEKAILATEVRELQSRLLCLSEERDRSLMIADEMARSLELRLAEAEKEIKAAEKLKLEREDWAQKALKHQEVIMEKVVEESTLLMQEAEANAKLREFLMDRGTVVDILQGEISVICTDMRSLKEKFDERVPFSKSLFTSHTSCILASSSSSSSKSMTSERVDQVTTLADSSEAIGKIDLADSSVTVGKIDPADSSATVGKIDIASSANDSIYMGEEKATDDNNYLANEGWEIFDF